MECIGKALSHDFTWNLPDFTKSARFHEIRNERLTIAGNGRPVFWNLFKLFKAFSTVIVFQLYDIQFLEFV